MKSYTVGFLFDDEGKNVLLIQKSKPEWQQGKWNGIGGRIEDGEAPSDCMEREFLEKTGIEFLHWQQFAYLKDGRGWGVYFFYGKGGDRSGPPPIGREDIENFPIDELPDVLPNLRWLIPMALSMEQDRAESFEIFEIYPS